MASPAAFDSVRMRSARRAESGTSVAMPFARTPACVSGNSL
jgi:hypothetical protein